MARFVLKKLLRAFIVNIYQKEIDKNGINGIIG
jgi:hypothetical protein